MAKMDFRASGRMDLRSARRAYEDTRAFKAHFTGLDGIPHKPYAGERIRGNNREFQGIALACRLWATVNMKLMEQLEPRARRVPGAWRMLRSGLAMLGRGLDAVLSTLPDDQFDRVHAIFTQGVIEIRMPSALDGDLGLLLMPVRRGELTELAWHAMDAECAICLKDGREIKHCALAKALNGCLEPSSQDSTGCPWRDEILELKAIEREEARQAAEAASAGRKKKRR